MMSCREITSALAAQADPDRASQMQRYFKTGPGQYAEGDRFLGIRVPQLRKLAKSHLDLSLAQAARLIHSDIHEHRMTALLILTYQFSKAQDGQQERIYRFFMDNTQWINNWDLVDVTVPHVVGGYLLSRDRSPLYRLARSKSLWERRMAIVATFQFIKHHQFDDSLKIADLLLDDSHDLIHKAVGWMIREVGKRDTCLMEAFLGPRYARMPRTMLRYAIEKLPEHRRQDYLKGRIRP